MPFNSYQQNQSKKNLVDPEIFDMFKIGNTGTVVGDVLSQALQANPENPNLQKKTVDETIDKMSEATTESSKVFSPLSKEDFDAVMRNAKEMSNYNTQLQGIQELETLQKTFAAQPVTPDLTPIAALVDAWTGSKFTPVAERIAGDPNERAKVLAGIAVKIQEQKDKLNDNLINAVKAQRMQESSFATKEQMDLQNKNLEELLLPDKIKVQREGRIAWNAYSKLPSTHSIPMSIKNLGDLEKAEALARSGKGIDMNLVSTYLLRTAGDTRLSNEDIVRARKPISWKDKFNNWIEEGMTGNVDKVFGADIKTIISTIKTIQKNRLMDSVDNYANTASRYGVTGEKESIKKDLSDAWGISKYMKKEVEKQVKTKKAPPAKTSSEKLNNSLDNLIKVLGK